MQEQVMLEKRIAFQKEKIQNLKTSENGSAEMWCSKDKRQRYEEMWGE